MIHRYIYVLKIYSIKHMNKIRVIRAETLNRGHKIFFLIRLAYCNFTLQNLIL